MPSIQSSSADAKRKNRQAPNARYLIMPLSLSSPTDHADMKQSDLPNRIASAADILTERLTGGRGTMGHNECGDYRRGIVIGAKVRRLAICDCPRHGPFSFH